MGFIQPAFLQNKLSWVYFVVAFILEVFAQAQQGEQGAVVGLFLAAIMMEVIRFLWNRRELPVDPDERKLYFVQAVGNVFAALFGSIFGVLVV